MIMNFQILKESDESLENSTKVINFLLLFIALFAISFTPIFVKISTNEISINATLFNRLWIVTIIFSCWNNLNFWLKPKESEATYLASPTLLFKIEDFIKQGGLWIAIVSIIHLSQRFTWGAIKSSRLLLRQALFLHSRVSTPLSTRSIVG